MPCDDCSRTETCPPCPYETQGSTVNRCDAEAPGSLVRARCGRGLGHAGNHYPDPDKPNAGWWPREPEPQGSEPSSTDLHKWKRCTGCGHQQHSVRCAESVLLDEYRKGVCDCLELTPAVDIAETCRSSGGCPKHPKTVLFEKYEEPKPKPCTCGPNEACGDPCTPAPELKCVCGHAKSSHDSTPCCIGNRNLCDCRNFQPGAEPRCEGCGHTEGEGCGCPPQCECGHSRGQHSPALFGTCEKSGCKCLRWRLTAPDEPPLTPEEEERIATKFRDADMDEASEDEEQCDCGHSRAEHTAGFEPPREGCDWCKCPQFTRESKEAAPPQPERRAPYVATYSVGGHLYEVAVPGDACLQAVDGALVIRHGLGPVAGLVGFQPLTIEPPKEGQ